MDDLILKAKQYLEESLDAKVEIKPSDIQGSLPQFYTEFYQMYQLMINERNYLMLEGRVNLPARTIRVHIVELERRFGIRVVYLKQSISRAMRLSLVRYRLSFLVPETQIYLPLLGISFREYYVQEGFSKDSIGTVAQLIILKALLDGNYEPTTATELARLLGYSAMSISRAFSELEEFELAKREEAWRSKPLRWLYQRKELWDKAAPYLQNPVQKKLWVKAEEKMPHCLAGMTALEHYSLINGDEHKTYATGRENRELGEYLHFHSSDPEPPDDANELQIWRYDPKLLSKDAYVEPLSLYLSLRDDTDERVQLALEEMLESIKW